MRPAHFALMVLICAVWGFNFVAVKTGLAEFPPLTMVIVRFILLGLVLAPFLRIVPGQMGAVALAGLTIGAVHFGFIASSLAISDASVVAIAMQLNVPFATLLSIVLLSETVGWRRWAGIISAFVGVGFIGFDPALNFSTLGFSFAVVAALTFGAGMVFVRRIKGVSALEVQAWSAVLSLPALALASLMFESGQVAAVESASLKAWAALLYTAFAASLIGHVGMYYLLQRYEVSLTGPLTLMAPVFGVIFGVTLFGEPVTWKFLVGGALTLGGVAIVAIREGRPTSIAGGTPIAIPDPDVPTARLPRIEERAEGDDR